MELISPILLLKASWKLSPTTTFPELDWGRQRGGEEKHKHAFTPNLLLHRNGEINLGHHRDTVGNIRVLKRC